MQEALGMHGAQAVEDGLHQFERLVLAQAPAGLLAEDFRQGSGRDSSPSPFAMT